MSRYRIDEIQKKVFINLANYKLDSSKIKDFVDFKIEFPNLVQNLLGESIDGLKEIKDTWKEKVFFKSKLDETIKYNISKILEYLIQKDNNYFEKNEIGSDNNLISLIDKILRKFFIIQSPQYLTNKVVHYLKDVNLSTQITNMTKSFANGIPFFALLFKASNGEIENVEKGDSKANYEFIKESFEKLNIPFVLSEDCISKNPDELCICIQIIIFFNSINYNEDPIIHETKTNEIIEETPPTPESNNNDQKKRDDLNYFQKKIDNYNLEIEKSLDLYENELNRFRKISRCCSSEDINTLRNYCHQCKPSNIKEYKDCISKIYDSFVALERNSERLKIPIPTDLIKIDDIKKLFTKLEEEIKTKGENIEIEEINVKRKFEEVENIRDLISARKKYKEVKEEYNFENWQEFDPKTFVYILGKKLQTYELHLEIAINTYNGHYKEFEMKYDCFNNEIQKKPELLHIFNSLSIQNHIKNQNESNSKLESELYSLKNQLSWKYNQIKDDFNYIKSIDPNLQINFSNEYFESKIELIENSYKNFKNEKQQEKNDNEKYSKYIINFQKMSQNVMDIYNDLQRQACVFKSILYTYDDIHQIKNYINKYNESKNGNCNLIQSVENIWMCIEQFSNKTQIPVPTDLIKVDDINEKFKNLEEEIKIKSEKFQIEKKRAKRKLKEVENVSDLISARKKFNEIREEYGFVNWQGFKEKTFIYILGKKLQTYEFHLKEAINTYNRHYEEFEKQHCYINNEIQKNSEDLLLMQDSILKFDIIFENIKNSYNNIKQMDPSIDITFSEKELQSQIESDKEEFEKYKLSIIIDLIEKEINSINDIIKNNSVELEKFSNYDNQYSSELCSIAENEIRMTFPNCNKLYDLNKLNPNNSEWQIKIDELIKQINDNKQVYTEKMYLIRRKEYNCKEIEMSLRNIEDEFTYDKGKNIDFLVTKYKNCQNKIKAAEKNKIWTENDEGKTISLYKKIMGSTNLFLRILLYDIEQKVIYNSEYIRNEAQQINLIETSSLIEDLINFNVKMNKFNDYLKQLDNLQSIYTDLNMNCEIDFEKIKSETNNVFSSIVTKIYSTKDKLRKYENSGIVIDLGYESLSITPVLRSHALKNYRMTHNQCGKEIESIFIQSIVYDHYGMDWRNHFLNLRDQFRYFFRSNTKVRINYNERNKATINFNGNIIQVEGSIEAPERILFGEYFNLSSKIIEVAIKASKELSYDKGEFLNTIVLVGEFSDIEGLKERLENDIKQSYHYASIISLNSEKESIRDKCEILVANSRKYKD